MGLAIGYSLAPFLFIIRNGQIEWVLRQQPTVAVTFGMTGLLCWIAVFVIQWRAKRSRV
jgi:hypothetical protein